MLPDSDMDIKVLSRQLPDTEDMLNLEASEQAKTVLNYLKLLFQSFPKDMLIRDVMVIPGRISVLTLYVDKLKVDITINKASDMIKTVFIQQSILALDLA